MVSFEEFKKLEIRIARVIAVADHPNADRLYVLTIDVGGATRQIVAGIKPHYAREALVGRQIVIVNNLEPAMLRGVESQAMLLAASDENGVSLLTADRDMALGSPVK